MSYVLSDAMGIAVARATTMKEYAPTTAVLLDIDGTLLDSNDAHARAWVITLQRHGHPVGFEQVRPLIGMGAPQLLQALLGLAPDDAQVDTMSHERSRRFLEDHLPALQPTPGARALVEHLRSEGLALVVATSSSGSEVEALLRQAGVDDLLACRADADGLPAKPDPAIVRRAVERAGVQPIEAVLIGDTPYDLKAGAAAGVDLIALRCGGWWEDDDFDGAAAIYDDPAAMLADWPHTPIARRRMPAA